MIIGLLTTVAEQSVAGDVNGTNGTFVFSTDSVTSILEKLNAKRWRYP